MEKWIEIRKGAPFKEIADKFGIDPAIARIIRNRDIIGDEAVNLYLNGGLDDLEDPFLLDGIDEAAALLNEKIQASKKIRVIGDYDIDGVCASYILVHSLKRFGADVDFAIPERMKDGYGLNIRLVSEALEDGIDTLLTCDNGISAAEQIRFARENGMTVIVTDHHEPFYQENEAGEREYVLPPADVLTDPKKPGCSYPNKELCGAALAWRLIHVYESLYICGKNSADVDASGRAAGKSLCPVNACPVSLETLPFAGFATVGDIMELRGENRILVKNALKMLPFTENIGMQALLRACDLAQKDLAAYHIGFVLGPCVNASGRIETAELAMKLFLSEDPSEASDLASRLVALNNERKDMTIKGTEMALSMAQSSSMKDDRVLLVYLPGVHESIVGIIAGKVRESTGKPSIILTDAQEEGCLKGSGRSIEEYPMFDALVACSDLLMKFGGHPMAAGLTLAKENLEPLRRRMNENCQLTDDDLSTKVKIDMQMPIGYISERLVSQLSILEPCGKGNEKPLFAALSLELLSARLLGQNRNVLKMRVRDARGSQLDAICFHRGDELLDFLKKRYGEEACQRLFMGRGEGMTLNIAYQPAINEFRGVRSPQIIIQYYS